MQRRDSKRLKSQIALRKYMSVGCIEGCKAMHRHLEVLRHLAHQTSKRCLAKKQIAVLLVLPANGSTRQHEGACGINFSLPDLPQRDGPWLEPVGSLDPARDGSTLARHLRG